MSPGADPAVGQSGSGMGLVSVDEAAEFKVQTQTQTAEFGCFSGAVINVDTKSGGNQFHGIAYEFLPNRDLEANNFFNNANGAGKNPARNNVFGGTIGAYSRPYSARRDVFLRVFRSPAASPRSQPGARVPSLVARAPASPAIQPPIDEYPAPNGPFIGSTIGNDTAAYFATATTATNLVNETDFIVRLDHCFSASVGASSGKD